MNSFRHLSPFLVSESRMELVDGVPRLIPLTEVLSRIKKEELARKEFDRQMRAIEDDIDSSFTEADLVPLDPVPEHVRRLLKS
jgi:hypothetical protein